MELPASHAREDKRHCRAARGRVVGGEVDVLLHLLHFLHLLNFPQLLQLFLHLLQRLHVKVLSRLRSLFLALLPPTLQDGEVEN